ncbi:hypothetical protein RSAG8_12696, partial [Rhizoctonia solani AG-8 WAC10335]
MPKSAVKSPRTKDKFTVDEVDYLKTDWYNEKKNLESPRSFIEVDGQRITKLEEFLGRCMDAFVQKFPYRHPDTSPAKIPKALRHLQYNSNEWPVLFRERLRNKFNDFNRQKRVRRASGIELSESDAPESENSSEVEDNEGDDETNEGDETSDHNGDEIEDEDPGRQASASIRAGSSGSQANPSSNQPADAVLQTQRAMVGVDSPNHNLDASNKLHFRPFVGTYDIWERSFKDSHYAPTPGAWSQDVNFRFEDMEIEQIDATIADLCAVITDSRTRLEQTMEDRTILAPEHIVVISSNDAHVGFPSDSTEFHSITPLPFNDPWDEPVAMNSTGSPDPEDDVNDPLMRVDTTMSSSGETAPSPSKLRPTRRVQIGEDIWASARPHQGQEPVAMNSTGSPDPEDDVNDPLMRVDTTMNAYRLAKIFGLRRALTKAKCRIWISGTKVSMLLHVMPFSYDSLVEL